MLLIDKVCIGAIAAAIVTFAGCAYDGYKDQRAYEVVRQVEIDTFYAKHKCAPEGYVATKYQPVRTYRCGDALYVVADMK